MLLSNNKAIVANEALKKADELVTQDREYEVISLKVKPIDLKSYTYLPHTYKMSFCVPDGTASIGQKKILVLEPSAISYCSKGNVSCLSFRLSLDGIEYSLLDIALSKLAKEYLPKFISDYLQPNDLLTCRHFALGFALSAFKPKDISTIDQLKNTIFFQKTSDATPKNLSIIAKNEYPLMRLYFNILTTQLFSITEENITAIIDLFKTISNIDSKNIQKIEKLLQESLDQETKIIKKPTNNLVKEILNNGILRIAILSVKNWNGGILLSPQEKIKKIEYYQQLYQASSAESKRILDCYSVSNYNFPAVLAEICCKLKKSSNQEVSYVWATSNHLMAFKIRKIKDSFKIMFYNPGVSTSTVKVIVINSINEITKLKIDDFLCEQIQTASTIKLESSKSNMLHSSFFMPINLTADEHEKYFTPEVIEIINANKTAKPEKNTDEKIIDLSELD